MGGFAESLNSNEDDFFHDGRGVSIVSEWTVIGTATSYLSNLCSKFNLLARLAFI